MAKINWIRASGIGSKIILLALIGIACLAVIGGVNIWINYRNASNANVGDMARHVSGSVAELMLIEEKFIGSGNTDFLKLYDAGINELVAQIGKINQHGTHEIQDMAEEISASEKAHREIFKAISQNKTLIDSNKVELNQKIQALQGYLADAAGTIDAKETELGMEGDVLDPTMGTLRSEIRLYLSYWYVNLLNIQELLLFSDFELYTQKDGALQDELNRGQKNLQALLSAVNHGELSRLWKAAIAQVPPVKELQASMIDLWQTNKKLAGQLEETAQGVLLTANGITREVRRDIERSTSIGQKVGTIIGCVGLLLLVVVSYLIYRSITRSLNQAIDGLSDGAEEVASASGQISSASQSLAQGASEQAASLEETSASLEEMASMTKTSSENSNQADSLMKTIDGIVGKAGEAMDKLIHSMEEMSRASDETQKIVKTIDEIAFQTNLLALNAAVEAARAGEAGAGFAVVADEVRNLAMRAADAAKNTAELIAETVKRSKSGNEILTETNTAFTEVAKHATEVGTIISEISAASQEQTEGISQINNAIGQMDQITQQNAANAEESASASQEMNAQSQRMRDLVDGLVLLIGGKQTGGSDRPKADLKPAVKEQPMPGSPSQAEAAKVIPFEEEFEDF